MTAAVQPRDERGRFAHAWLYETGPLPYLDRPSGAELPPPPSPPVRREANGAVLICDDERVNRHRVHVERLSDGTHRITYLDEVTR